MGRAAVVAERRMERAVVVAEHRAEWAAAAVERRMKQAVAAGYRGYCFFPAGKRDCAGTVCRIDSSSSACTSLSQERFVKIWENRSNL